jgi:hypothetical protein
LEVVAMTDETKKRWGEFGFKVLETLFDKGVLAIVLVVVTLFANSLLEAFKGSLATKLENHRAELKNDSDKYLTAFKAELDRDMENYRHRLAMQQYVAQKRFEAVDGVINSYNNLFKLFVDNGREKDSTKEMRKTYRDAIIAVVAAHNNKELVMPHGFSKQLEKLAFLHRGFLVNGFSPKKYRPFVEDLGDQLSKMGRDAIDPPLPGQQKQFFELAVLPEDRDDNKEAAKYLDAELQRWEQWKKTNR